MLVLFVEDDPMNRRVVKDMLGVAGVEMAEAPEGETGLSMIAENNYDLILMDLRMPGMDGLTAIRHIRAREDLKAKLPVIVVTADTGLTIREDCLAAGADDVILKPVAMDLLFDAIGRLMAADRGQSVLA
ncbi:MAG: response regulator [Lacisediminimonas sp.]|nr:response regulator [Lacisediminimonas sp.]